MKNKTKYIFSIILIFLSICIHLHANDGVSYQNAIDLGAKFKDFTYTDTRDSRRTNSYSFITTIGSNPVIYKITLDSPTDITISHCGSELYDTFVRIQDSNYRDLVTSDNSPSNKCSNKYQAYLNHESLAAGTYYIISQGGTRDSNGNITTSIQGRVRKRIEYNLGNIEESSQFKFTDDTKLGLNQNSFRPTNEANYKFRLSRYPMRIKIKSSMNGSTSCTSLIRGSYNYRLDCFPEDDPEKYIEDGMLLPGYDYCVISEGMTENGLITTFIEISGLLDFNVGEKDSSFEYTHTQNTNEYLTGTTGGIFYKIDIKKRTDLKITNSAAFSSGTCISLLNSNKTTVIATKDFAQNNPSKDFLRINNLEPGVYYVSSKGNSQEGIITTNIEGYVLAENDLGSINSAFDYYHTQDTDKSRNEYNKSTNDAIYKITLTGSSKFLRISNSTSLSGGSSISLLNSSKTILSSKSFSKNNPQNEYLEINGLQPGTYYVLSEGQVENGEVSTYINISNNGNAKDAHNYIKTRSYTASGNSSYLESIQYIDGLGRPIQGVQIGLTPGGEDLVSHQEYDRFGRDSIAWLPSVLKNNDGNFVHLPQISTNTILYNSDQQPYSKPVYESSPLNRPLAQYGPGQDWHAAGKAVKYIYGTNLGAAAPASQLELDSPQETSGIVSACDKIILSPGFYFSSTSEKSMTLFIDPSQCVQPSVMVAATEEEHIDPAYLTCTYYKVANNKLVKQGSYNAGQLYVTQMSDEDGNRSYEFKDKLGQVVLTRQVNGNEKYDTYYVYDDSGNQCYVLPPKAVDHTTDLSDNSEAMKQYAYLYKYDTRNRCIEKRIPGCEPIYYVYDKADRLIFSQDGEQRKKGEWAFSIPDVFGRIVLTGTCKNTLNHAADPLKNSLVKATWNGSTNTYKGYTVAGITLSTPTILTVNYYDNYAFLGLNTIPNNANTQYNPQAGYGECYGDHQAANSHKSKGLLTGTLTAQQLPDGTISPTYLYTVMYYDIKGQAIQTKSNNHLAGGIEKEYVAYNFTGQPTQRMHIHQATGKTTQTETYTYQYDHALRLTKTTHKLNNNAETILAENTYDELGRLKTNKKAGQANLTTTYGYNVRSWTKTIASPLFNQTLYYNDPYAGSVKRYNGNVGAMTWQVKDQTTNNWDKLRGYTFTYDNISQLTAANYLENGTASNNYKTSYTYDKHGNMTRLTRYGKTTASAYNQIDNVTMTYTGNQLTKATDAIGTISLTESNDFKDYANTATEYTYNANGAMTKDLNKGITDIKYNLLNLPMEIQVSSRTTQGWNKYLYSASGVKLRVESQSSPVSQSAPVSMSIANTYATVQNKVTDYVGNIIYENNALKRILVEGGYIENGQYHFYLTDHLGNNRVVANQSGKTIQNNHYYPFGMPYAETSTTEQGKQPYKFGGKELDQMHGLNLYDFSARYYNPDLPRFTSIDPLAEKKPWLNPYHYCSNNPINRIDPDGRFDGFPVPNTSYWQQAATNYKVKEHLKENAPELQRKAGEELAGMSDLNDAVVLGTMVTRGGDAINVDGTPASTLDKVSAAGGAFLPVVSGAMVARGLKKLGKLFGLSFDTTTSTAKGGARFISDTDGKIIDTKTTPKGSYTHADGSRTDVLQDRPHFDKKTQTDTGTSHTHEPPKTNTNPTTGQTYPKKSESTHSPTYEEIKNIENGTAIKTK